MNYSAEDYAFMATRRVAAFCKVADELGKKHPLVELMGSLAWGRSPFERGPDDKGLRDCVREMSGLDGMFEVFNVWCRLNDSDAQRVLLKHYPRGFEKAP